MRQLEGAYLSNIAVERSKQRLQRLPYIESVETETTPVPGSADLVDVDFRIKDGLPGQFGGGVGIEYLGVNHDFGDLTDSPSTIAQEGVKPRLLFEAGYAF